VIQPVEIELNAMAPEDWDAVRAIYLEGIATRNATFEQTAPEWKQWDEGHLRSCRIVARLDSEVVGWTALSPVSKRRVYAGVVEESVYVAERARGRGIGKALLAAVVEASEREGIWMIQTGIFPENAASIELHKKVGFRVVGVREKIGAMNGQWRDVVFMERRSRVAGVTT
jgi:phosphinothricin acetyltransferase